MRLLTFMVVVILLIVVGGGAFYFYIAAQEKAKAEQEALTKAALAAKAKETQTVKTTAVTSPGPSTGQVSGVLSAPAKSQTKVEGANKASGPLRNTRPVNKITNVYNTHDNALDAEQKK